MNLIVGAVVGGVIEAGMQCVMNGKITDPGAIVRASATGALTASLGLAAGALCASGTDFAFTFVGQKKNLSTLGKASKNGSITLGLSLLGGGTSSAMLGKGATKTVYKVTKSLRGGRKLVTKNKPKNSHWSVGIFKGVMSGRYNILYSGVRTYHNSSKSKSRRGR